MTDIAMQSEGSTSNTLRAAFGQLREELETCIIGQQTLVEHLLVALLADGHLLVEGAPGLAKTTAIKELAKRIEGDFHRLQFTPDLLPGDLTGTEMYRPQTGEFEFQQGPIFHNLVLADEINRAPAKVQSALLEAMGERQITVGQRTYTLATTVSGDGDTEPDRTGRHLPVTGSTAGSLPDARAGRLPGCQCRKENT